MKEIGQLPAHLMWENQGIPEAKNKLQKDDFMKLLLTQLQHQDPMKPMDHKDFSAQLAQFGSLEQLSNIDQGIQSLRSGAGQEQKLQAIGMIGKEVEATGAAIELKKDEPLVFKSTLSEGTQPIRATILSTSGAVVREIDLSQDKSAGKEVTWDGLDTEGKPAPAGQYQFRLVGLKADGTTEEVGSSIMGQVSGVEMNGDNPVLVVETKQGKVNITLEQLSRVNSASQKSSTEKTVNPLAKENSGNQEGAEPPLDGLKRSSLGGGWRIASPTMGRIQ